jgi:hypothetical protein
MQEQWRPVPGSPGYEVSDRGRVRSPRVMLRQGPIGSGHLAVQIPRNGKRRTVYVHALVLEAFIGPRPRGQECRHLDDDKTNNTVGNLRWGTRSENTLDKVRNGRHPMASKTHCVNGHEYTAATTYINPRDGHRRCRICRRTQGGK